MVSKKEKSIAIIQRIVQQYDGIFDPTTESDSRNIAEHIFKVLRIQRIIK